MYSKAQHEILMGSVRAFRTNLSEAPHYGVLNRLYNEMVSTLDFYHLSYEVRTKFEVEIDAIFDAAYFNRPLPMPVVPVTYDVCGETVIVAGLARCLQQV